MLRIINPQGGLLAVSAAALTCVAACGCRTAYQEALAARQDVMFGSGAAAEARAARMSGDQTNSKLGNMELARLKMLKGDFSGSSAVLGPQLEELFDESNEGPVLKKGEIAGNILAGTVADDMSIPYDPPAYELIFGLQYQALNSLMLGERDNSRVYIRRATAVQEQLKDEAESGRSGDGGEEAGKDQDGRNAATAATQISEKLSPVADAVRSVRENALAWYLAGVFLSCDGEPDNAAIAFREAERICPAVSGFAGPAAGDGRDAIIVYEEDLVDIPEPVKIPLPFGGTIWSIDFPSYGAPPRVPSRMAVETGGKLAAEFAPVVNVQALAYRSLKDRIPGIATRNVTRAAVKIAAQQIADHMSTGHSGADTAIWLGVLAFNAFSTATSEADIRSWQTVPEHVQLARVRVPPGCDGIVLRNTSSGRACEIKLPPEGDSSGTLIVWFTDVRGYATVAVADASGRSAATWARTSSLIYPYGLVGKTKEGET